MNYRRPLFLLLAATAFLFAPAARAFLLVVEPKAEVDVAPPAPPAPSEVAPPAPPAPPASGPDAEGDEDQADEGDQESNSSRSDHHRGGVQPAVFTIGEDAVVSEDSVAEVAFAIFGDTHVKGRVSEVAFAIGGNNRVDGEVHEVAGAIFGNVVVRGHVRNNVVAVIGGVELAPGAIVDGQVVCIGGTLVRGEGSVVRGEVVNIAASKTLPDWTGVHVWLRDGALWGKLLIFDSRALFVWWFALGFLGLYLVIALLAPRAIVRCAETLEQNPGRTILATVFSAILLPLILLILGVTVIGLPIVGLLILVFALAGKAALLVFFGRRFGLQAVPLALLAGAVVITALYLIPVLGILTYVFATSLGVGMVSYTVIREWPRSSRKAKTPPTPPAGSPFVAPPPAPAPAQAEPNPSVGFAATDVVNDPIPAAATNVTASVPEPIPDADTGRRAGFLIRFAASLIDVVVVGILSVFFGGFFMALFAVYCAVLWKLRGTTLGGIIVGIRLVRLDGKELDWSTAIIRVLGGFLSFFALGLGFIWVAIDEEAQSWHDRIAGTTIIHARSRRGLI